MKSNTLFILTFIFSALVVLSCNGTKTIPSNSEGIISKIKIEKISMGSNSIVEITKDEILHSSTNRDGTGNRTSAEISQKQWQQINRLVGRLELSEIGQWEGPTQARFYDGAAATMISIEKNDEVYDSQSFDEGKPPAELQPLYDYLESLVNQ